MRKNFVLIPLIFFLAINNLNAQSIFTITATPDSICNGAVSYLNATSDSPNIYWFDNILDTVPIGQSASGENFGVYPTTTKAFYAEVATGQAGDSTIFNYTGTVQTFIVPDDVVYLSLDVMGAQGGSILGYGSGGGGGRVQAIYPVTPGQILEVYVGQQPDSGLGGWNGGGNGTQPGSMGGGGASDIRIGGSELSNRIIVAGGGWGRAGWYGGGGAGGGSNFADSSSKAVNIINEFQSGHGQIIISWSTNRSFIGVNVDPILPVSVYIYSESYNICTGDPVNILTYTTNPGLTPVYQWFVNNENVGENSPMYSYIPSNNDTVKCLLTSSENCVDGTSGSNSIEIKVKDQSGIDDIQIYCNTADVCVGGYIQIYGGLNMDPELRPCSPFSIRWLKNGIVFDSTNMWGPYISNAALTDSGYYSCVVSNSLGCDTSNLIHIQIHPIPEPGIINTQLLDKQEVLVTFIGDTSSVNSHNWNFSGGEIISGSGNGPYVIKYADGNYRNISLSYSNGYCFSPVFYSDAFKVELFERLTASLPNFIFGNSEWGDYNNDGLLDILSTGEGFTKIIKNLGNDSLTEINSDFPELWYSNCKWLDFNNDGRLDFLVSGSDSSNLTTKLFENLGNDNFIESGQLFQGVMLGALACFDYNNDGLTDILISGEDSLGLPLTSLFKNSANFIFQEDSLNIRQFQYSAIDFADYNKDGYIDFMISGRDSTGAYTLLYKNLNGSFTEMPTSIINTWSGDIAWGDYNNDGFPDIVISGYNQEPIMYGPCINRSDAVTFKVYKNNGDESFTEILSSRGRWAFFNSDINWGDINSDGTLDLLATGFAGNHSCYIGIGGGGITITDIYADGRSAIFSYHNDGSGIFTDMCLDIPRVYDLQNYSFYLPAPDRYCYSLSISPGDYDNDGKLDILRGGSGNVPTENLYFNSSIYKNLLQEVNLPPGIPGNLNTVPIKDAIIFTWQPATDILTPQPGLSYNLRLGTTPGGSESISAMSDSSGWRKVAAIGNMGQNTQGKVLGLAPGTYYWSVQAIDNGFAGGSFAPEETLIVTEKYEVTGNFAYNNSTSTHLDSLKILLRIDEMLVDSADTNTIGQYQFQQIPSEFYDVSVNTTKPWSGVNATDALKIQRHFAGLETITEPVRLQAADVNNSSSINGTDALKVKRRFAGLDTTFAQGDWTFAKPLIGGDTIVVNGTNVTQDFYGLCVGDVNGSNNPSSGKNATSKSVEILHQGIIEVGPGQEFDLPIMLSRGSKINAISLIIPYPTDLLDVIEVKTRIGEPAFTAQQGEIRIAWSEVQSLDLQSGDTLIILRLKATEKFAGDLILNLATTEESELAEGKGDVILLAELIIPTIKSFNPTGLDDKHPILTQCKIYPNPAYDLVNIEVKVSKTTTLDIEITDMLGRVIISKQMGELLPGINTFQLYTVVLKGGIYVIKLKVDEKNGISDYLNKLAINR